ncbi:MAG: ornithine carbamoyltransferase [Candidatus Hydrothermarchaeota archaeon]|nr:ornithine carbamoyltransferase [Candidatus Hydrothermarchaeota archaeon]
MNLISIADAENNLDSIFGMSAKFKKRNFKVLKEKTLAMMFEKASTRTRVSFEVAMTQLGGHAVYLDWTDMQLRRGETIKDTARTLSRYVDGIMLRANKHEDAVEMGKYSTVPVINGLTDLEHPCQVLSDLFTIKEFKKSFDVKLAYIGDGNNVCNSLLLGSSIVGMDISVACPKGYEPNEEILRKAKKYAKKSGAKIEITHNPASAVADADIVYTDVWVSMGQESEEEKRLRDFKNYQVNAGLIKKARNPLIMHCLPAKRGLEITEEVLESKNSIVFEQAENRLHVQKALLCLLLGGIRKL